jgi:flagellin
MVQTAAGAASVISSNLTRMTELATQAMNGTYSDQQISIMQNEFDQLNAQNTQIQETTDFNGVKLFENSQNINIALGDGESINFATQAITPISVNLTDDSMEIDSALKRAIEDMTRIEGGFGQIVNLLDNLDAIVKVQIENIFAAESRISDVDVASEVASMTQDQIITQSAIAAQAHTNSISQVMSMLL